MSNDVPLDVSLVALSYTNGKGVEGVRDRVRDMVRMFKGYST